MSRDMISRHVMSCHITESVLALVLTNHFVAADFCRILLRFCWRRGEVRLPLSSMFLSRYKHRCHNLRWNWVRCLLENILHTILKVEARNRNRPTARSPEAARTLALGVEPWSTCSWTAAAAPSAACPRRGRSGGSSRPAPPSPPSLLSGGKSLHPLRGSPSRLASNSSAAQKRCDTNEKGRTRFPVGQRRWLL